jgi:hypothetical protein
VTGLAAHRRSVMVPTRSRAGAAAAAAAGLTAGTAIVSSAVATAAVTAQADRDMTGPKALICRSYRRVPPGAMVNLTARVTAVWRVRHSTLGAPRHVRRGPGYREPGPLPC